MSRIVVLADTHHAVRALGAEVRPVRAAVPLHLALDALGRPRVVGRGGVGRRGTRRPTPPRRHAHPPAGPVDPRSCKGQSDAKPRTVKLSASMTVGRAPECELRLDDTYTSQQHARLFAKNNSWFVEDLGSTNGTFVNEQKLAAPAMLQPGDKVRVGPDDHGAAPVKIEVGSATDIGRVRERNEDSVLVDPPLYVVADGMGGHRGGQVASQVALETMEDARRARAGAPSRSMSARRTARSGTAPWRTSSSPGWGRRSRRLGSTGRAPSSLTSATRARTCSGTACSASSRRTTPWWRGW